MDRQFWQDSNVKQAIFEYASLSSQLAVIAAKNGKLRTYIISEKEDNLLRYTQFFEKKKNNLEI